MSNKEKIGDIIMIPYKKGWHTYGRILIDESYAIYDCPSQEERKDYSNIIESGILFTAYVDVFAIKEGHWKNVTNIPLESKLQNFYPRYFNASPTRKENLGFYEVYKEEIEDAIQKDWIKTGKIQLHGIYGHMHVEERINNYYDGKRNEANEWRIALFKKGFGLM